MTPPAEPESLGCKPDGCPLTTSMSDRKGLQKSRSKVGTTGLPYLRALRPSTHDSKSLDVLWRASTFWSLRAVTPQLAEASTCPGAASCRVSGAVSRCFAARDVGRGGGRL